MLPWVVFSCPRKAAERGQRERNPVSGTTASCASGPGKDYMDAAARSAITRGEDRRCNPMSAYRWNPWRPTLPCASGRQIDTPRHSECPATYRKQTSGASSDRHNFAPSSAPPYLDAIFIRESAARARKSPSAMHVSSRVQARSLTLGLRANSIGLITQLRSDAGRRSAGGSVRGPRHASLACWAGSGEEGHHVQRIS